MLSAVSIDTPRHPQGVKSPPGVAIAVAVMAVMGLYGFTTTLQKSLADRRASIEAVKGGEGDVRLASAIAPTPALVYAVSDAPPPAPIARRVAPVLPAPEIAPDPVPVNLVAVVPSAPAPVADVSAPTAPAVEAGAVNVSATEPSPAPAQPAP